MPFSTSCWRSDMYLRMALIMGSSTGLRYYWAFGNFEHLIIIDLFVGNYGENVIFCGVGRSGGGGIFGSSRLTWARIH
jgi:hypothetical protein